METQKDLHEGWSRQVKSDSASIGDILKQQLRDQGTRDY
jgi:hypothetical protein